MHNTTTKSRAPPLPGVTQSQTGSARRSQIYFSPHFRSTEGVFSEVDDSTLYSPDEYPEDGEISDGRYFISPRASTIVAFDEDGPRAEWPNFELDIESESANSERPRVYQ